jgi:hypothetical protein
MGVEMIDYLDANRPNWRTEPLADVVAWTRATTNTWVDVSWLDFQMWVSEFDLRPTITDMITTGTAAQRTAAQFFTDVLQSGQILGTSDSRVRSIVSKGVSAGPSRNALLGLATLPRSHWELMGRGAVEGDDGRTLVLGGLR